MLIVPELRLVLILPPRTGSSSLRRAVLGQYKRSFQLYRHMEASGVPKGYETWKRYGVVRDPLDRMWSLYKFLRTFGEGLRASHEPKFAEAMRESVKRPFEDWILNNEVVFTSPFDRANEGRFWPNYTVDYPMPENRKSQRMYIRPDLGTQWWSYRQLPDMAKWLDVDISQSVENSTWVEDIPTLSSEARDYMELVHGWDMWAEGVMR